MNRKIALTAMSLAVATPGYAADTIKLLSNWSRLARQCYNGELDERCGKEKFAASDLIEIGCEFHLRKNNLDLHGYWVCPGDN